MPKYFVDLSGWAEGQKLQMSEDAAHHLMRVLRVRAGEKIIICDGKSIDYQCTVTSLKPLTMEVNSKCESKTEPECKITLYQAMPKADKLEWIIQKSVELGVYAVVPVYTEHSVSKNPRMDRLQKIAESAAGQSMRGIIPYVHPPIVWDEAFKQKKEILIAAHEKEKNFTLKMALKEICSAACMPKEVGLWIGPEGGFSKKEAEAMENANFYLVSLGARILRSETAAIAGIAQIMMEAEG